MGTRRGKRDKGGRKRKKQADIKTRQNGIEKWERKKERKGEKESTIKRGRERREGEGRKEK